MGYEALVKFSSLINLLLEIWLLSRILIWQLCPKEGFGTLLRLLRGLESLVRLFN